MYVGFRITRGSNCPILVDAGLVAPLCETTFASDFAFFRKLLRSILGLGHIVHREGYVDLSFCKIHIPQPGLTIGWPFVLERDVCHHISAFAGNRPVKTARGFAKPWRLN